ncbi:hypothetical protein ONZ45_g10467 [Pleurotus djamor]|nr:hypothetical protein ONZ45_g10467 [Pleurotus djamor]
MFPSPSSTSLPPELWLQIFRELTNRRFPMRDLDYKLLRCDNPFKICRILRRPQLWTARSLSLVCESWNSAVKPLLYETIFISKASQIKSLASLLRVHSPPSPNHPHIGSWIKRLVIMINEPRDRIESSDFGQIMSSSFNLTALHIVMYLPDESTVYRNPNSQIFFQNILHTSSTLRILNLVACVPAYTVDAIPRDFFDKMTALPVREWTLERLRRDHMSTSVAMRITEIFVLKVSSFPVPLPKNKRLRRFGMHIPYGLPVFNNNSGVVRNPTNDGFGGGVVDDDEEEEEEEEAARQAREVNASEFNFEDIPSPSEISAASLEVDSIGSASDAGGGGGGGFGFNDRGTLQDTIDPLPPTVKYLSLACDRWEELHAHLRRLPASVTTLGLEVEQCHSTDTSYRYVVQMCRDIIAPRLAVVQLSHWQTCVDLRTRHEGLLKEFVEVLGRRGVELWDSEGFKPHGWVILRVGLTRSESDVIAWWLMCMLLDGRGGRMDGEGDWIGMRINLLISSTSWSVHVGFMGARSSVLLQVYNLSMSQPSISTHLPAELWHQIFNELMIRRFPMKDLDYKLLRCKNPLRICRALQRAQPWMARLLLVCKIWYMSVLPFIYGTIFLRKASQIKALASLLRTNDASPSRSQNPGIGSWITRLVIMIDKPEAYSVASSDFGDLMSCCHNLTALHIVKYLRLEATVLDRRAIYRHILLRAPTLQILNIGRCMTTVAELREIFTKLAALRAFRCDTLIEMDGLRPLEYLSAETWTLGTLINRRVNLSVQELFIQGVNSFPLRSYPVNERLRRLNLDITKILPRCGWETWTEGIDGVDDDSHGLQWPKDDSEQYYDLQKDVLDRLPPNVTYLSLICGSWEDLRGRIRRLPESVTSLGLEAGKHHDKNNSYRHLIHVCRRMRAPGLTVVQLNHWQTCVDLRTRHPGVLKEFVEMLRNRNVELWDAEGYVMKSTIP